MRHPLHGAVRIAGFGAFLFVGLAFLTFHYDPLLSLKLALATGTMILVLFGFIGYAVIVLCWMGILHLVGAGRL